MTDQTNLERAYRRWLASYPRAFRREHEEEILGVLMSSAHRDQRRPGLAAAADLLRSGLGTRLHPVVPRSAGPVRAAVRLMQAGAVVTAAGLLAALVSLPFTGDSAAMVRVAGRAQPLPVAITVGIGSGLVLVALWLWMARANGQGRNWARIVSTVLVSLATLHLFGNKGVVPVVFALLMWVIGLAAVWLLWRPDSNAFFNREQPARIH